ncbi:MAG: acetate kinase, partial [Lachnospiraceae bacterium]|nr:acetate kinase [Lachnospiraceae bacterium]
GLTPLEGLIMGTRSGDIDPAIIEFIAHKEGKSIDEVMTVLNKKSGVLGLSDNLSSDFRDLEAGYHEGNARAINTMETFAYRVAKYIGAYTAAMNGVDVICFTAGVGENSAFIRSMICNHYLGYLGVKLDEDANKKRGEDIAISTADSSTTVMVIPTNEELAIARETYRLVKR